METVVRSFGNRRIVEVVDESYNLDDLKGDCFINPEIPLEELARQERDFEARVKHGVFGYILQQWDPSVGVGWVTIDSVFGFVGCFAANNHYIVDEWLSQLQVVG